MAKISSYTTVTPPALTDRVIGTDSVGTPTDSTKNFLIGDIVGLVTTPDLSAVLTAGNSASNNITLTGSGILTAVATNSVTLDVSGQATLSGNTTFSSTITAVNGIGAAGEVLSSQGVGLPPQWIAAGGGTPDLPTVLAAGDTALNGDITLSGTGSITVGTGASTFGGALAINGGIRINSALRDTLNLAGSAGQVLSSTVTGVEWKDSGVDTLSATTAISSAEILGLNTLPKTIVAGVAGKHIVPLKLVAKYTFVTTAYTIAGSTFGMVYLGAAGNPTSVYIFDELILTGVADGTFLNSTEPVSLNHSPKYSTASGGDDLLLGWRSFNPTLGDSTLEITVIYSLVDA